MSVLYHDCTVCKSNNTNPIISPQTLMCEDTPLLLQDLNPSHGVTIACPMPDTCITKAKLPPPNIIATVTSTKSTNIHSSEYRPRYILNYRNRKKYSISCIAIVMGFRRSKTQEGIHYTVYCPSVVSWASYTTVTYIVYNSYWLSYPW